MNSLSMIFRFLMVLVLIICCSQAMSATLVYERQYSHLELGNNILRITLDEQGLLTVDRPLFMKNSGRFEAQINSVNYHELQAQLRTLSVDTERVKINFQQRRQDRPTYISHPEMSRFFLLDQSRNVLNSVEIESIDAQLMIAQDDPVVRKAYDLEQQLWQLMDNMLATQQNQGELE